MNLKIWHKMIIGISIPSFIALIGGWLTYGYINNVKNRQDFVQIADDLKEQVLEVRRNEKNFLLHKDEKNYKSSKNAITVLTSSADNITSKTAAEIGEEDIAALRKSIQIYSTLMYDLYVNYQEESNDIEEVREAGREMENFVATQKKSPMGFILNLRRLEKNYMLFRDKDSFNKLNNALSQLNNIAPFCLECVQYLQAMYNLFSAYQKSDAKVNELQVIGSRLEGVTNKIASRERERVNSFLTLTKRILLIALVLLCTLGPLFVYKTASLIATPIKRLADITRKISNGDLTLRAPIKERDETSILAHSFNAMLDYLQLTQKSLEESMELLHEKQAQLVQSEKLASLGTLASGVAHELNNPLNNIYLASQTLFNELDIENTPEIVKESMKDIFSQTLRVKKIVNNLLEFARGKRPELKKINIVNVMEKVIKQMRASGEMSHVNYNITASENIEIFADSLMLEQVFTNLFGNAVEAMDGNGSLNIVIDKTDSSIKIKVSDTGKGVLPKNLKKIFDPFFTTKEKGTGLGLAIVYSIIKKHDGEIEVDSEPDKGTTFTIILPCEELGSED